MAETARETTGRSGLRPEALAAALSRYELMREVGHGAMGVVFEARQRGVGRRVALKVLPPNLALRERTVRRFLREASSMGRLAHPRIVDVYEVESVGDLHYFAMRFVEGPPLDEVLRAGPLAIGDVLQVGMDVAGALAHAHARGVMHRDVKPANILRDGDRVTLTDFGLARRLDGEQSGSMTESGDLVGTPLYMAPEQISGELDGVDGRCDVWGLGATLYELLVQRPPFTGSSPQRILNDILHRDPPLLRRLRDDVPRDLEAVVLKCLEKDTARRYTTAAALLEDLRAVAEERPVSARPPRPFDPAVRWIRRHPAEAGAALAMLLVVAVLYLRSQQTTRRLDTVQEQLTDAHSAQQRAEEDSEKVKSLKTLAGAQQAILEARLQWALATPEAREDAQERLEYILAAFPVETYPTVAIEAMETYAAWLHDMGLDERMAQQFDALAPDHDPGAVMPLRAAMLTGQGRFEEALAVHRARTALAPGDAAPFLDAGRTLRRMAEVRADGEAPERLMGWLLASVRFHSEALALAVRTELDETVADALVERARSHMALGAREAACEDLRQVQAHDETRADARFLLFQAENDPEIALLGLTGGAGAAEAPRGAPEPRGPALRELRDSRAARAAADELEEAGRGLKLLYDGVRSLFSSEEGDR